MTPEERIIKAKVALILDQPWFGQLSCYIIPIAVKDMMKNENGPIGINARGELFYDPEWIKTISDKNIKAVLCHEIMHLAYQHPFRYGKRDQLLFNIAADIKVNLDLVEIDFELPVTPFIPNKHNGSWSNGTIKIENIQSKTTEQIYEELEKHAKKIPVLVLKDLIAGASGSDPSGKKEKINIGASELSKLGQDWKEKVNAANAQFKGHLPLGLKRDLDALENPELPWIQILRQRFMARRKKSTWAKVNKRYLPSYFPGTQLNKSLKAVVGIDTSGSISRKQLTKAASEIWGLTQSFREFKLYVVTCDTETYDLTELKNGFREKFLKLDFKGGGGTDFRPVFEMIHNKYRDKIDCLIYFTDGYGDFPKTAPKYPVYWITDSSDVKWPFGKVIRIDNQYV
jgi:predicted metal-dependent peptidase